MDASGVQAQTQSKQLLDHDTRIALLETAIEGAMAVIMQRLAALETQRSQPYAQQPWQPYAQQPSQPSQAQLSGTSVAKVTQSQS